MTPLKLVTFDVTGTLLFFTTPIFEKYVQIGIKHGVISDVKGIEKNFKQAWKLLSTEHPNFGKNSGLGWQNWWKRMVEITFQTYIPTEEERALKIPQIGDDLIAIHSTRNAFTVRPGTEELLEYLKTRNVNVGVISNYDPRLYKILKITDLQKYLDFVLISYDFGYSKPDRRIFEEALKLGGCASAIEGVHVGDDLLNDYLGAKEAGMQSILIASDVPNSQVKACEVYEDFYKLKRYFETCMH